MKNRVLQSGLRSWKEQTRTVALFERAQRRLYHRRLFTYFSWWAEAMFEARETRARKEAEATRVKARNERVLRFAKKMRYREKARPFRGWHAHVLSKKAAHLSAKAHVNRMRQQKLARAFDGWAKSVDTFCTRRRALSSILRHVTLRIAHEALRRSFLSLKRHQRVYRALNRAIQRLTQRRKASVFHVWAHNVSSSLRERRDRERQQTRVVRFANRIYYHRAVAAFSAWRFEVSRRTRDRAVVSRCVRKLQRRAMSKAFLSLSRYAKEGQERRAAMARLLKAMQRNLATRAYRAWVNHVSEQSTRRVRISRAVAVMNKRVLFRAYRAWVDEFRNLRLLRSTVSKSIRRLTRRLAYRAFRAWSTEVEGRIRRRGELLERTRKRPELLRDRMDIEMR